MGRYTPIHSDIWFDDKFKHLAEQDALFFIYALTSPHCNMIGYYRLPIPYACVDTGWSQERVQRSIANLCETKMIGYDYSTKIILVRNYLKWNPLSGPKQVSGAVSLAKTLPQSALWLDFLACVDKHAPDLMSKFESVYPIDTVLATPNTLSIPYPYNPIRSDPIRSGTGSEQEQDPIKASATPDTVSPIPVQQIVDLYHEICASYPRLRTVSETRRRAIKARFNSYKSIEPFREMFTIAEASDFMKGANDRNWRADFDWMMKDANMPKVLEGKYSGNARAFQPNKNQAANRQILDDYLKERDTDGE